MQRNAPRVVRTRQIPCSQGFGWANRKGRRYKMKKIKLALVAMAGIFCFVCGCKEEAAAKDSSTDPRDGKEAVTKSSFTDPRDGKTYKTVKIGGTRTWMAENLNYAGKNNDIGRCHDKKPENCKKYGALYNWNEAMKACPAGWHLPSNNEWRNLIGFAGGKEIAGKKLKAKNGWRKYECKYTTKDTTGRGEVVVTEHDKCATDEFGFSALPGGYYDNGHPYSIGDYGSWWSATTDNANYADRLGMKYDGEDVYYNLSGKGYLFSVRCVKDIENSETKAGKAAESTVKDPYDGKTYKTVKIGTQTWMAENLNYAAKGSKCHENKPENCQKYGRQYNWAAAKKACPSGWHLPSNNEWDILVDFAGGDMAGKNLKASSGWNNSGNGTDAYGFAALPGGYSDSDGFVLDFDDDGYWWSSSENNSGGADYRHMRYSGEDVYHSGKVNYSRNKNYLLSVRCLQD
jgi:uncharacterized protein (TIGR02145 family)